MFDQKPFSSEIITNRNEQVTTRKNYMTFSEENVSQQRTTFLKYDQSETRKGYTGYEKDAESGLDFAQARYYNSGLGRFTSVDPLTASATIKNPQTFNRYSYVLNSPYKFTDPLGLIAQCCTQQKIDKQIEKDWGEGVDENGKKFYLDKRSLETIKQKLRPYYNQAARLGADAQQQTNAAAEKPPRVIKTTTEVTDPGSVTQATRTANGQIGGEANAGLSNNSGTKAGTNNIEATDNIEVSEGERADGSIGITTSTTTTISEPTTKTTTESVPDDSVNKAAENMTNAIGKLSNLADRAAIALNGTYVTGTYTKTDATSISAGPYEKIFQVHSFDTKPALVTVFEAGRDSEKPK